MAGPAIHVDYTTDEGVTVLVLQPQWQATLLGISAGTSTGQLAKGTRKRYRMLLDHTTGREHKVTMPDVGNSEWLAAFGAAPGVTPAIPGVATGHTYSWEGRTGEKSLVRG